MVLKISDRSHNDEVLAYVQYLKYEDFGSFENHGIFQFIGFFKIRYFIVELVPKSCTTSVFPIFISDLSFSSIDEWLIARFSIRFIVSLRRYREMRFDIDLERGWSRARFSEFNLHRYFGRK